MATACGILALCSSNYAGDIRDMINGLRAIQHRGPHTWGISTLVDGQVQGQAQDGHVPLSSTEVKPFPISCSIGHVGYCRELTELRHKHNIRIVAQPLLRNSHRGDYAVSLNGRLGFHIDNNSVIDTSTQLTDIERIGEAIERHPSKDWIEVVHAICASCVAAFTFTILTNQGIFYARDIRGYRPFFMKEFFDGKRNSNGSNRIGVAICSELIGATEGGKYLNDRVLDVHSTERTIAAGTIGHLRLDGSWKEWMSSRSKEELCSGIRCAEQSLKQRCSLEAIHFMRGGGKFDELVIDYFREECGRALAKTDSILADGTNKIVVGCPRSGISAGRGYAAAASLPYVQALRVSARVSRRKSQLLDDKRVVRRRKENPELQINETLNGQTVILVDDLVIRGDAVRKAVALLKEAGAGNIHVRIASPLIKSNCVWGTVLPDVEDLFSTKQQLPNASLSDIGADSLKYLSHHEFKKLIGSGFCHSCFLQPNKS